MQQLQKVLWSKGVLLNPQHLQLQDRYIEELLAFRLDALSFCPWGFGRLDFDREAIAGGTLVVTQAAGLLPDGLVFDVPNSDPAPPPLPLMEHWKPDEPHMLIYLAIPEHRPGGLNVTAASGERSARYVADVIFRRDENTGQSEKPIQVARRNLRLIAEGESLEGYVALPIARVKRGTGGLPELDPTFIPPLVDIAASAAVMSIASGLVEILSDKSTALAGMRGHRNAGLADFGISNVANFWLLYTVNSHLPRFRHLYETRRGHPAQLYSSMIELAGTLMTFAQSAHPRDLPVYAHDDLTTCFPRLDAMVRELLDAAVPSHHVSLPLRRVDQTIFATAIDQDRYLAAPQMFIAISAAMKQDELVTRVPQILKVSSGDQIERLIQRALPGVALTHTVRPTAIPIKANYQYFQLERSGDDWDAIRMSRNLAVYAPAELPDPVMELVILLPQS